MPEIVRINALLPQEIAKRAEEVSARKCRLPFWPLFILAILAGAFIALGAIFSIYLQPESALVPASTQTTLAQHSPLPAEAEADGRQA